MDEAEYGAAKGVIDITDTIDTLNVEYPDVKVVVKLESAVKKDAEYTDDFTFFMFWRVSCAGGSATVRIKLDGATDASVYQDVVKIIKAII